MTTIDAQLARFHHATPAVSDDLERALADCIAVQRTALATAPFSGVGQPEVFVSEAALADARRNDQPASDLRTNADLGNCLVFHTSGLRGSVDDDRVVELRERVDLLVEALLRTMLRGVDVVGVAASGHYWYPPGSYMAWHTNSRVPGWRAYLSWVQEPDRSFFRYLDDAAESVVTSWDTDFDLRVFRIDETQPFWHAVCAETDRFSFGYRILTQP